MNKNAIEMIVNETFEKMEFLSYDGKVSMAKHAVSNIVPLCSFLDIQSKGFLFIAVIFEHAFNADGKISATEKKFLEDVFGNYKENVERWMPIKPGFIDTMYDMLIMFVSMDSDGKKHLAILIATLLACDNRIVDSEKSYFKTLIEKLF